MYALDSWLSLWRIIDVVMAKNVVINESYDVEINNSNRLSV